MAFQPWFENQDWTGDVIAKNLGVGAQMLTGPVLWSAKASLDFRISTLGHTDRKIVTIAGTARQEFLYPNLTTTQQATMVSANLVNFVRGDRSQEKQYFVVDANGNNVVVSGSAAGIYRARASALGDIIHSRVMYVGAPPANYTFDAYASYRAANASRAGRVFFGGNDGMVHSVDAANGSEIFAYVPSMLIPKLPNLAVDPYVHNYYVDGGMAAGDANFSPGSANWHTVLVGGLGAGGPGLYGLDVSNPDAGTPAAAAAKIMWEITPGSTGFADLGEVYGDPVITRLNSGQWVALVGNGYNNNGSGHAVLYVIDIATGSLIKALDTGAGSPSSPNGLSAPAAIDMNSDGIPDVVYAGDIDGNLWKFDLSSTSSANWTAPSMPLITTGNGAFSGTVSVTGAMNANGAGAGIAVALAKQLVLNVAASATSTTAGGGTGGGTSAALVAIAPQPIIGAPDVAPHPINGVIVYFATGKMFTSADAADATVQNYAYGIWDGAPPANNAILEQSVTESLYGNAVRVRTTSGAPINWSALSGTVHHLGWRTALPPGERVLGTGFVREGRYHFVSVNPTIVNSVKPDGENWLMELDYLSGGVNGQVIFDLNGDGLLTDADRVSGANGVAVGGNSGIPAGVFIRNGLVSQPVLAILNATQSITLFDTNPFLSPGDPPITPPGPSPDRGVIGGHFDVEVWYRTDSKGSTTPCSYTWDAKANPPSTKQPFCRYVHTHEYDDKFDVTGIDMTNASDPAYNLGNYIGQTTPFVLLMGGQAFSPAVSIKVGNRAYIPVYDYQTDGQLNVSNYTPMTLSALPALKFNMPKDAFTSKNWAGIPGGAARVGLQPTTYNCVVQWNSPGPAPSKPWLSGALYVQMVDPSVTNADIEQNVAGDPTMGYHLKTSKLNLLLASYSIFWHTDACYLDATAKWSSTAPPAYSGGVNTKPAVPAAGSQDPPYDSGTPMPISVKVNRINLSNGNYQIVTTTTYANGSQLIVTETFNKQGTKTSTSQTTQGVPPSNNNTGGAGNSGGTGKNGPGQNGAFTGTAKTGFAESRNAGKVGRVNWHEIFRD
jgi:hypothetical protein